MSMCDTCGTTLVGLEKLSGICRSCQDPRQPFVVNEIALSPPTATALVKAEPVEVAATPVWNEPPPPKLPRRQRSLFEGDPDQAKAISGTVIWVAPKSMGVEGWKAGKLRLGDGDIAKFVGSCIVKVSDTVRLHGAWENDPKWGRQFRVTYATATLGRDPIAIRKLLESDSAFHDIGPKRAGWIVDFLEANGVDLDEVLESEDLLDELKRYAKLPDKAVEGLVQAWSERREENIAKAKLLSIGVPVRHLELIWKSYSRYAPSVVTENPYSLTDTLEGFGIAEADKIAITGLKFNAADERRIVCGLTQTMKRIVRDGHTWIRKRKLSSLTVSDLQIGRSGDHKRAADALESLIAKGRLKTVTIPGIDGDVVCEPWLHAHEEKFMRVFGPEAASAPNPNFVAKPLEPDWASRVVGFAPNERQIEAVEAFSRHRFVAITGSAGTGKTACITMILRVCIERGLVPCLAAPTGRAAMRLNDLLSRAGLPNVAMPQTIHKTLGYQGNKWTYNEKNKLPVDVLIVDESSMVDLDLMGRVIDALKPTTALVLVGDHNQLPPVGPGAVLRDVIEGELCRVIRLETVIRQAGVLKKNATELLRGVMNPTSRDESLGMDTWIVEDNHVNPQSAHDAIAEHYRRRLTELGQRGLLEIQVISPQYDKTVGIDALNKTLRKIAHEILYHDTIDPGRAIGVNDKVIQTKNDYQVGIMNGDQGVVVSTDGFVNEFGKWEPGWTVSMQRGGDREDVQVPIARVTGFMLAYAISCHRYQGSESEYVIGAVHSEHSYMLNRKLIYTMATRASRALVLIGDRKGLHDGTRKDDTSYRRTLSAPRWLLDRLAQDPGV